MNANEGRPVRQVSEVKDAVFLSVGWVSKRPNAEFAVLRWQGRIGFGVLC